MINSDQEYSPCFVLTTIHRSWSLTVSLTYSLTQRVTPSWERSTGDPSHHGRNVCLAPVTLRTLPQRLVIKLKCDTPGTLVS